MEAQGVELDARYVQALRTTLRNRGRRWKVTESAPDAIPDGYGSECDGNFAYIAGFTSGGAPFGVTWDEMADPDGR